MATSENSERFPRLSRRGALRAFGLGAAGAVAGPSVLADQVAAAAQGGHAAVPNHFGRLFPTLPPFAKSSPSLHAALLELGRPGGLLDAADDLSAGPVRLITDPGAQQQQPQQPGADRRHDVPRAVHRPRRDVRRLLTARRSHRTGRDAATSGRRRSTSIRCTARATWRSRSCTTPPTGSSCGSRAAACSKTSRGEPTAPRSSADPRNDEHIIISGLHAAFIRFHNACVDASARPAGRPRRRVRACPPARDMALPVDRRARVPAGDLRRRARPGVLRDRRLFRPRRGQARCRWSSRAAPTGWGIRWSGPRTAPTSPATRAQPFFGFIFDRSQDGAADPADLRGGQRAPRRFVGWQTFFDFGDGQVKPNKRIDTRLSTPLFHLPLGAIASHDRPTALPQRTLLRHLTWSLPTGQAIAREIGVPP